MFTFFWKKKFGGPPSLDWGQTGPDKPETLFFAVVGVEKV